MEYKTHLEILKLKNLSLKISCLVDLNSTIDSLFEKIEEGDDPKILEDLCPYFGVIWPASLALAQNMDSMGASMFQDKDVIELGCGLALPSLVAAHFGARVMATDFHPDVPVFLEKNLKLNSLSHLSYENLDWQKQEERPAAWKKHFDWILASDVLYEKHHPAVLADAIEFLLKKGGRVILSDPMRPYVQPFLDEIQGRTFRYDSVVKKANGKEVMVFFLEKL